MDKDTTMKDIEDMVKKYFLCPLCNSHCEIDHKSYYCYIFCQKCAYNSSGTKKPKYLFE